MVNLANNTLKTLNGEIKVSWLGGCLLKDVDALYRNATHRRPYKNSRIIFLEFYSEKDPFYVIQESFDVLRYLTGYNASIDRSTNGTLAWGEIPVTRKETRRQKVLGLPIGRKATRESDDSAFTLFYSEPHDDKYRAFVGVDLRDYEFGRVKRAIDYFEACTKSDAESIKRKFRWYINQNTSDQ